MTLNSLIDLSKNYDKHCLELSVDSENLKEREGNRERERERERGGKYRVNYMDIHTRII